MIMIGIKQLNAASQAEFVRLLDGTADAALNYADLTTSPSPGASSTSNPATSCWSGIPTAEW